MRDKPAILSGVPPRPALVSVHFHGVPRRNHHAKRALSCHRSEDRTRQESTTHPKSQSTRPAHLTRDTEFVPYAVFLYSAADSTMSGKWRCGTEQTLDVSHIATNSDTMCKICGFNSTKGAQAFEARRWKSTTTTPAY